jgi:hypothetical protein
MVNPAQIEIAAADAFQAASVIPKDYNQAKLDPASTFPMTACLTAAEEPATMPADTMAMGDVATAVPAPIHAAILIF